MHPPLTPPPAAIAPARAETPATAAEANARRLLIRVAGELARAGVVAPGCSPSCRAAVWGLVAQADSAARETAALPAHLQAVRRELG